MVCSKGKCVLLGVVQQDIFHVIKHRGKQQAFLEHMLTKHYNILDIDESHFSLAYAVLHGLCASVLQSSPSLTLTTSCKSGLRVLIRQLSILMKKQNHSLHMSASVDVLIVIILERLKSCLILGASISELIFTVPNSQ